MIPSILEPEGSSGEYRKNRARLIQKIYEFDPLTCPNCQGRMRIIAFIEDDEVIKKIRTHIDASVSQLPPYEDELYCDPQYPIEAYAS